MTDNDEGVMTKMSFGSRLRTGLSHGWDSFRGANAVPQGMVRQEVTYPVGQVSYDRPDRPKFRMHSERTIIASIYTRLAIDVAGVKIEHVRNDENDVYLETIKSGLNNCLNVEANIDQGARHFRTDIPLSLFQEGSIAIVPVDTDRNPLLGGSWEIQTMRVGRILQWWPDTVLVRLYNDKKGIHEDLQLPKKYCAIVENPFYSVMNEPNSTLQRLVHKLSLLDNVDEISSSGKLDIIIQLPYPVRNEARQNQAQKRLKDLKDQLQDSTYGIAYTDGSEKITQLNRAVENNLLEQVKYLKTELYNELGLTEEIMNGTADDNVMLNYRNRTIEPIMDAITEAMARSFLTKTARTQGQTITYFESPFKMLSISKLAEIADVLSRNQIITPNEIRPALGLKPSKEPQANQLVNSNMPLDKQITSGQTADPTEPADTVDAEIVDPADEEEARLNAKMLELGIS